MAAKFSLSDSLAERQKLTNAQYREIERLYKDLAKKAAKEAERLKSSTVSGKLQAVELGKLEKKLQEEADKIGARLESSIPSAMKKAAAGVVSDAVSFQGKLGISIEGAYRRVPTDIVETLVSGKLYKGKWSLSKSIWADISKTQSDISKVVAEGIALNKSSYDIAKDLEMYVDPSAKKPWDWSKVYPGTKKKIDYNAQRLARTMVGHAYQQSVVAVCKDDPFVDGIEWISGHSTTTCELCRDRNGKVFPAGKLPLDHPNGKCSFAPHVSKSLSQIGDDLADWVKGKPNEKMDKWYLNLRVKNGPLGAGTPVTNELKMKYEHKETKISGEDWMDWAVDPEPFQEAIVEKSLPKYLGGEKLSKEGSERIQQIAYQIQLEGLTTKIKGVTTAYRGESYDSLDEIKRVYGGKHYTTTKLTSTTSQRAVAEEYAEVGAEELGGWKVLQIITEPTGIRGVQASPLGEESSEIVCPIGNQYKVTGLSVDEEAKTVKVYLFGQDNKKKSKKEVLKTLG